MGNFYEVPIWEDWVNKWEVVGSNTFMWAGFNGKLKRRTLVQSDYIGIWHEQVCITYERSTEHHMLYNS